MLKPEYRIGQYIMMVRIIHIENEKALVGTPIQKLAEWLNVSVEEMNRLVDDCCLLSHHMMCRRMAMTVSREVEKDGYQFFWYIFFYYGLMYIKILMLNVILDFSIFKEAMIKEYQENSGKEVREEVIEGDVVERGFEKFVAHYVECVEEVLEKGYHMDVVSEMLEYEMTAEKLDNLKKHVNGLATT